MNTKFQSIIAKANGNGELEFHCRTENKPVEESTCNSIGNKIVLNSNKIKEWEQSAQVFKPINKYVGYRIIRAFIDEQGDNRRVDHVIADRSNLVKYIELKFNSESDLSDLELYAFYKSPSKEEPIKPKYAQPFVNEIVQPVGEAQESQDEIIHDLINCFDTADVDSYGYQTIINAIKSKFKITRK